MILGTARSDGLTRRAVSSAFPAQTIDLIDLNEKVIADYDYLTSGHDDFPAVMEAFKAAASVVFATPVYWYAMSGVLKRFFDRLTDVTGPNSVGRRLAGRHIWLMATGTDEELPEGFEVPFQRTAAYFDMCYRGCFYAVSNARANRGFEQEAALTRFGNEILQYQREHP